MGHSDLNITMIDTHFLMRGPMGVISPADLWQQPLHVDTGSDEHVHCGRDRPRAAVAAKVAFASRGWFTETIHLELDNTYTLPRCKRE